MSARQNIPNQDALNRNTQEQKTQERGYSLGKKLNALIQENEESTSPLEALFQENEPASPKPQSGYSPNNAASPKQNKTQIGIFRNKWAFMGVACAWTLGVATLAVAGTLWVNSGTITPSNSSYPPVTHAPTQRALIETLNNEVVEITDLQANHVEEYINDIKHCWKPWKKGMC